MSDCAHCTALRRQLRELGEEFAEWKRQAGPAPVSDVARAAEIRARLRLRHGYDINFVQPGEIRTLLALVRADGQVRSRDQLLQAVALGSDYTEVSVKAVDVRICRLRKILKAAGLGDVIENRWGQGYLIPSDALTRVRVWIAGIEA